jgi:hypothetical protein
MRRTCWPRSALASLLLLASCFHATRAPNTPQPARVIAPTPTPSPALVTPPVITPTPGASVPAATAPPIAKPVTRMSPDSPPQILAISISETTVSPGDSVSGSVVTSSNVASVEARIGGYAVSLSKVGVGRFALTYKVMPLPWFIRGSFTMRVIARNTRGDAVARAIPLQVR